MKELALFIVLCFIAPSASAFNCSTLFNAAKPKAQIGFFERTFSLRHERPVDVIELYHPDHVLAVARVVILKDYNGNVKSHKVIQSENIRLNFGLHHIYENFEYRIQISGPPAEYKLIFLNQLEGFRQEVTSESLIQI